VGSLHNDQCSAISRIVSELQVNGYWL
jgi:hypothetical protein